MVEKRQFSSEYVQARRIVLASSTLLLLISAPGVKLDKLPILGLELTGVSPLLVWTGLIAATVYFFLQYAASITEELSVYKDVLDSEENALSLLPRSLATIEQHISAMRHLQSEIAGRVTLDRLEAALTKRDVVLNLNRFRDGFVTRLSDTVVAMMPNVVSSAPHTPPQLGSPEFERQSRLSQTFRTVVENAFRQYVESAADLAEEPGSEMAWNRESLAALSMLAAGNTGLVADEFEKAYRDIVSIKRTIAAHVFWRRARITILEIAIPVISAAVAVTYGTYHLVHAL